MIPVIDYRKKDVDELPRPLHELIDTWYNLDGLGAVIGMKKGCLTLVDNYPTLSAPIHAIAIAYKMLIEFPVCEI